MSLVACTRSTDAMFKKNATNPLDNSTGNPTSQTVLNGGLPNLLGVSQYMVLTEKDEEKIDILKDWYMEFDDQFVIFYNSREKAESVTDKLREFECQVSCIHGDISEDDRNFILNEFKTQSSRILVTIDLFVELNIEVRLIINYDIPKHKKRYLRRAYKFGWFGKRTMVVNFASRADIPTIRDIEHYYRTHIPKMPKNIISMLFYSGKDYESTTSD
jgi:translation initiation factor 4A